MRIVTGACVISAFLLTTPAFAGNGHMGPGSKGDVIDGDLTPDIDGPTGDTMSDQGELYGDLYVIQRYEGGEAKRVPKFEDGEPVFIEVEWETPSGEIITVEEQDWITEIAIGGEPVLSEDYAVYTVADEETGEIVTDPATGNIIWYRSPFPSQCKQPVASYLAWGDISGRTGLSDNRIPLAKTYDSTWERTECEIGELELNSETGEMTINTTFLAPEETWTDPVNGDVVYKYGVEWEDLVQEVHFGRLNVGRAPEAVLQASFDEAIRSINSAVAIELDASGRILLTKALYSDTQVDPDTGEPLFLEYYKKAIDSPLENLALYVKILQDGHLVTPGDEREPIDRSENGGIPIWKMVDLEEGPSQALRPTIDIDKMRDWGLGSLVDVNETTYYTYYEFTYDESCTVTAKELVATPGSCVDYTDSCGNEVVCSIAYTGIVTDSDAYKAEGEDFSFGASFLAAAADKTGYLSVDMIVYLNSILGLNKVVGYSAYDDDGNPTVDAINYSDDPVYFDFLGITDYDRGVTYRNRGEVFTQGGNGSASLYTGEVRVLQGGSDDSGSWQETDTPIITTDGTYTNTVAFAPIDIGWDDTSKELLDIMGERNIHGFTQMSQDALSVIDFVHTFQIPSRR